MKKLQYLELHSKNLDKFFSSAYKFDLLEECSSIKEIKKQILQDIKDERDYELNRQ